MVTKPLSVSDVFKAERHQQTRGQRVFAFTAPEGTRPRGTTVWFTRAMRCRRPARSCNFSNLNLGPHPAHGGTVNSVLTQIAHFTERLKKQPGT